MALAKLSEIDVALEGVKGAKNFFEAKVIKRAFSLGMEGQECPPSYKTLALNIFLTAIPISDSPCAGETIKHTRVTGGA